MRIGIVDIVELPARGAAQSLYRVALTKQFASVMPQAISVWCRQLGHDVSYVVYYGIGDLAASLPEDLDLAFVSCFTRTSPLAYVAAKLLKRTGATTVIGGPHARAFPRDCLRFFDIVVHDCNKALISEILAGHIDVGSVVASRQPIGELPGVSERLPEIRGSAYYWGRQRPPMTAVPMLASTGCPYGCDFCIEADRPYRPMPPELLADDIRAIRSHLPNAVMAFHDPNFAVHFDDVFEVLEAVPAEDRVPFMAESSLSLLGEDRIGRLRDTRCRFMAPGIETWYGYGGKSGAGNASGEEKVRSVAERLKRVHEAVPVIQVNLMLGLDSERNGHPVELTKDFMTRTPFAWSSFTVATPFGGTAMFERLLSEARILDAMPFALYDTPFLTKILDCQDPAKLYQDMIELLTYSVSREMNRARWRQVPQWSVRLAFALRVAAVRSRAATCREILSLMRSDRAFRAFHEGAHRTLPEYYRETFERRVGRYAELLNEDDRRPVLEPLSPSVVDA